jgi:hypothetical protein
MGILAADNGGEGNDHQLLHTITPKTTCYACLILKHQEVPMAGPNQGQPWTTLHGVCEQSSSSSSSSWSSTTSNKNNNNNFNAQQVVVNLAYGLHTLCNANFKGIDAERHR